MILTLYYFAATCLQWYRLGRLKTKFTECMAPLPAALSHADVENGAIDANSSAITSVVRSSSVKGIVLFKGLYYDMRLCSHQKLGDLISYKEDRRCCTIIPQKSIDITGWVTFPKGDAWFPLEMRACELNSTELHMPVLICVDTKRHDEINDFTSIKIEKVGNPVAWKLDGHHLLIIISTSLQNFTSFSTTFMSDKVTINDNLEVQRAETVTTKGISYELRKKDITPGMQWIRHANCQKQWDAHLVQLKNICSYVKYRLKDKEDSNKLRVKKTTHHSKRTIDKAITNGVPSKATFLDKVHIVDETIKKIPVIIPATSKAIEYVKTPTPVEIIAVKDDSIVVTIETTSSPLHANVKFTTDKHQEIQEPVASHDRSRSQSPKKKDKKLFKKPFRSSKQKDSPKSSPSKTATMETSDKSNVTETNVMKPTKSNWTDTDKTEDASNRKGAPNILVYSDSMVTGENVKKLLNAILQKDKYVVYTLSFSDAWWGDNAQLVVICGSVSDSMRSRIVDSFLSGAKVLCLCSNLINAVLPTFTTAEVRERELVRFSYDKWRGVRMIHHVFCYQPSPGRKLFAKESSEETGNYRAEKPRPIELVNSSGKNYKLFVEVLGSEDTWHTPSVILATVQGTAGRALFSQVHFEVEPCQYESQTETFEALSESDHVRLDILKHLIETHLNVSCATDTASAPVECSPIYFLGDFERKKQLVQELSPKMENRTLEINNDLKLKFYELGDTPNKCSSKQLPVLLHSCPDNFNTFQYFDCLCTDEIGRLVLFTDIITSTQKIIDDTDWTNGLAVVALQQTNGTGRTNNVWLSPRGCLMSSLQIFVPINSPLSKRASLLQIIFSVAIVAGIKNLPGYKDLPLGIKWPNDIYVNKQRKIGGLIVRSRITADKLIANFGFALNLDNDIPTTCINTVIRQYNAQNKTNLAPLTKEVVLSAIFNYLEYLINQTNEGKFDKLYEKYYDYWLHSDAEVTIQQTVGGSVQKARVISVDDFGYLKVKSSHGKVFTVHPDGNSFDMLSGLIAPKIPS